SANHLHEAAHKLELGRYLRLGRGEELSGGRDKRTLITDALEALIAAGIGYIGISKIHQIDVLDTELYEVNTKPLGEIGNVAISFLKVRNNLRDILIDKFIANQDVNTYVSNIRDLEKKMDEDLKEFGKTIKSEEVRREYDNLQALLVKFSPLREKIIDRAVKGEKSETMAVMRGEALETAKGIDGSINKLFALKIKGGKEKSDQNAATGKAATTMALTFTCIGALAAVGLGVFLSKSIAGPLNRAIAGLTEGSDQVAAASGQVSAASQALAEGASEQAAGLEETSSSMEEMSSMTKQNADHARQAKAMMGEANEIVDNVNHHMGNMAQAIAEITKSSEETGKIIKTIDEIAFQTNLLALNAAVEAARAGEAGAGFAVVADEVRNLALRASEAAKNTNNLIENTMKAVKNGNDLTLQTQEAFKKNVEIASKIGKLIDEISAASQEQAQGIGQVSNAVAEMDKVIQKNAANAEESASAAEEMNAQAEQMKGVVQELSAIVGGSQGNGSVLSGASRHLSSAGLNLKKGRELGLSAVSGGRKILEGLGKKIEKKPGPAPENRKVSPEKIIPLEDGGFKEF
ncbi:MAG TPA: methyl-accepting chemotaxis protein, partial [Thermodesulfobacteriota bacterium]|nr:methyl-accepting chemotaxis protein [Thermodesulfobacteriota bacterium]